MSVQVLDVARMGVRRVNEKLKRIRGRVRLANPNSAHFLVAGICNDLHVEVDGSVGYYVGTCMHGPSIRVRGNAGWYAGDNMTAGKLVIDGISGDGTGQGMYGGIIVVRGDSGVRTGQLMKNGTIVVGGNSGYMTGLYAFGGRIIVCGDIGPSAGESIIGARIYVGGSIASLGKNATVVPPTKKELREVQSLVRKAGLKPPRSFKKIVPLKKRFFKLDTGES